MQIWCNSRGGRIFSISRMVLGPVRDVLRELSLDDVVGDRIRSPEKEAADHCHSKWPLVCSEIENEQRDNYSKRDSTYEEWVVNHQRKCHPRVIHHRKCHPGERRRQKHGVRDEHQAFVHNAVVPLPHSDCDKSAEDDDAQNVTDQKGRWRKDRRELHAAFKGPKRASERQDHH